MKTKRKSNVRGPSLDKLVGEFLAARQAKNEAERTEKALGEMLRPHFQNGELVTANHALVLCPGERESIPVAHARSILSEAQLKILVKVSKFFTIREKSSI